MLLNIVQGIGKFSTTKNYLTQNVNSDEIEKPYSKPLLDNQTVIVEVIPVVKFLVKVLLLICLRNEKVSVARTISVC